MVSGGKFGNNKIFLDASFLLIGGIVLMSKALKGDSPPGKGFPNVTEREKTLIAITEDDDPTSTESCDDLLESRLGCTISTWEDPSHP